MRLVSGTCRSYGACALCDEELYKHAAPTALKWVFQQAVNLNPAMGRKKFTQRRKGAKSCVPMRLHLMGESLDSGKCLFFASLRLCVTSHSCF